MVENVHCPAPRSEDYGRPEDPGFREDPDMFIEFDDGVFYQASLDRSEVAIMADYPGLLPFSIVSIRKSSLKKEPPTCVSPITLNRASQDRRSASRTPRAAPRKVASTQGEPSK
mgnify:CR=1 FL=1